MAQDDSVKLILKFYRKEVNFVAEIKRNRNESFEAFMRRVKKRWQQSGKMRQVKKIQFYTGAKSKGMRKRSALHRLTVTKKIEYLKKIGRLPEEVTGHNRR
jgi:ribosomal protein S21